VEPSPAAAGVEDEQQPPHGRGGAGEDNQALGILQVGVSELAVSGDGQWEPRCAGQPRPATATGAANRLNTVDRVGLELGRRLGTEIVSVLTQRELAEPATRTQALVGQLTSTGSMTAALRIAGAVGVLSVTADLPAAKVTCHVEVDAPREGEPTTLVNCARAGERRAVEGRTGSGPQSSPVTRVRRPGPSGSP
jgi:hypothetical protein